MAQGVGRKAQGNSSYIVARSALGLSPYALSLLSTPHSSRFARLASEAFYLAVTPMTLFEIINIE
jgi:hypothetical protein